MSKKILWVDDVKDFLDLMEMEIIRRGYHFVAAYNGAEGLEMALSEKPDLIFLDIMMPVMNGFEMFQKLKVSKGYNQAPVIMVSAKNDTETMETIKDLGVHDYIWKPELKAKLDKMLKEYLKS